MKSFLSFLTVALAAVSLASVNLAGEVGWAPEATMDSQLFPSLLIATATARPDDIDEEEQAEGSMPIPYTAP